MTDTPDFIKPDAPAADRAANVRGLAAALVSKAADLKAKQMELEALQAEVWELSSRTLPDALAEAGMDRVGLPELGVDVRLDDWTRAVLPKGEGREAAVAWLTEHGAGDLIKSEVRLSFERREHNRALETADQLRDKYGADRVSITEDIHHMTYTAWAREQREAGEALPLELLGVSVGRVAKVVARKEK